MTPSVSNAPLWHLAWQRLRQRPLQYLLCIVGIALGVAMMVSIDLANGSAQRAFAYSTDAITGKTTHRIVAIGPTGVENAVYSQFKRDWGDIPAAPLVEGYGNVEALGGEALRLVGVDFFAEAPFRGYLLGSGVQTAQTAPIDAASSTGWLQLLTDPQGVVLAQETADRAGLQLGDTFGINFAGRTKTAHLIGTIASDSTLNRRSISTLIFADLATAQEFLGQPRLSAIDLILDRPETVAAVRSGLPEGLKLETAAAQKNAVQQMTAAFELNLLALSLLALVVGMFLIYNTVTFSVIQRRPLFGILRCLGVTQGQLFTLILGEAAIFSTIGSLLGLGLGVILGRSVVGLITQTINDFYFVVNVQQVTLANDTLIQGFLVGVAAALLASALPAWEAMNTAPSLILQRSTLENRVQKLLPWLVGAWAGLSLAGIGLLRWREGGLVAAFGGLFAVLLGAALLIPPLSTLVLRGISPTFAQIGGAIGRMAPRDILRSLSRSSVAIAALMVSVSVIVGVSVMIGSFRGTVVSWLDQTLQADIYVSPPSTTANQVLGKLDPAIVADLKTWPQLTDVVTYNDAEVLVRDYGKTIKLIIAGGDVSQGRRPYAWIRPDLAPNPWKALDRGEGVIVSEALLLRNGVEGIPEAVTLETPQGDRTFAVLAVFYDYSSDRGTIILDDDRYQALWQDDRIASLGLFVADNVDPEALALEIRRTFQPIQSLSSQSNRSLRQGSLEIFDRTFAITQALRLLAIVVAFIGVLSTLMSLQLERTRELGILRATGMTPRQLGQMTLLETGLMGALAGLFAMPLGYVLAWILIYVINVRSFGWTLKMVLQPAYFWQALLVAIVAALLAGLYPALRLGRMNIAIAVRQE